MSEKLRFSAEEQGSDEPSTHDIRSERLLEQAVIRQQAEASEAAEIKAKAQEREAQRIKDEQLKKEIDDWEKNDGMYLVNKASIQESEKQANRTPTRKELIERIETLENESAEKDKKIESLENKVTELTQEDAEKDNRIESLENKVAELTQKIKEQDQRLKELTEEGKKTKRQLAAYKGHITRIQNELKRTLATLDEISKGPSDDTPLAYFRPDNTPFTNNTDTIEDSPADISLSEDEKFWQNDFSDEFDYMSQKSENWDYPYGDKADADTKQANTSQDKETQPQNDETQDKSPKSTESSRNTEIEQRKKEYKDLSDEELLARQADAEKRLEVLGVPINKNNDTQENENTPGNKDVQDNNGESVATDEERAKEEEREKQIKKTMAKIKGATDKELYDARKAIKEGLDLLQNKSNEEDKGTNEKDRNSLIGNIRQKLKSLGTHIYSFLTSGADTMANVRSGTRKDDILRNAINEVSDNPEEQNDINNVIDFISGNQRS